MKPRIGRGASRAIPLAAVALWTACERGPETRAFVERLGSDTTAVEVFTRSADRIEGDVIVRSPRTRVAHYVADIGPDGTITRLDVEWRVPGENLDPELPPSRRYLVTLEPDTVQVLRFGSIGVDTLRAGAVPGLIPHLGRIPLPVALVEQAARQADAAGGDRYEFTVLNPGRAGPTPNAIVREGGDTVSMDYFGNPMLAVVDDDGRVLAISGRRTTMKIEVEPAWPEGPPDLLALAAEFGERDARGEGLGPTSPRDSAVAALGEASLSVDYGRPSKRGREIFGTLVPWGEVWRTGANAATHFSTDRDIAIGDTSIPAGTYTLWTVFTPEAATLIVNEQTGQWGTQYDESRDLARIPLAVETVATPVERFQIAIEPTDAGGLLVLSWDSSRFSAPIRLQ